MNFKKFVACVLTLCMSICVLAVPTPVAASNGSNGESAVYIKKETGSQNVVEYQEISFTKLLKTLCIGAAAYVCFCAICAVVTAGILGSVFYLLS